MITNGLPAWLKNEETYTPSKDRDAFINKSILSLLGVISRIRSQSVYSQGKYQANAAIKLVFTLLLAVLVSLSSQFIFIIAVAACLLLRLSAMKANMILKILKPTLTFTLVTFIILLPSLLMGNPYSAMTITPKVFCTILAVGILSRTTRWDMLTSALRVLLLPNLFIFVLDITLKYIVMLGELTLHMLNALKLRSVGKNKGKYTALSGVAGTMFLKSRAMAEDMHAAMQCRGFTGEYRYHIECHFNPADAGYIAAALTMILAFIFAGRL